MGINSAFKGLIQDLVLSFSISDRPVHRLRKTCAPDGHLLRVTIPDAALIQFDLPSMSKILLETCRALLINVFKKFVH